MLSLPEARPRPGYGRDSFPVDALFDRRMSYSWRSDEPLIALKPSVISVKAFGLNIDLPANNTLSWSSRINTSTTDSGCYPAR